MTARPNEFGLPEAPLLAPASVALRIDALAYTAPGEDPEDAVSRDFDRVCLAVTAALERAAGRTLARRAGVVVVADGRDVAHDEALWLIETRPVERIVSVHVDTAHAEVVDVVFDGSTLIDPGDWRLLAPEHGSTGNGAYGVAFRAAAHPRGRGARNVRIELDCGYTPPPDEGAPGDDAVLAPPDLCELFALQTALTWRRRSDPHVHSQAQQFAGGGGGTTAMVAPALAASVIERLLPYCTAEHALNLRFPPPDVEARA